MTKVFPLHDASFNGMFLHGGSADLHFKCTDGASRVVQPSGLDAVQMDNFREGNIVSHFEAVSAEIPREFASWERLYPGPHPTAAREYHQKHFDFLQRKRDDIESGRLTVLLMSPAFGADLLAVCESVEIKDS